MFIFYFPSTDPLMKSASRTDWRLKSIVSRYFAFYGNPLRWAINLQSCSPPSRYLTILILCIHLFISPTVAPHDEGSLCVAYRVWQTGLEELCVSIWSLCACYSPCHLVPFPFLCVRRLNGELSSYVEEMPSISMTFNMLYRGEINRCPKMPGTCVECFSSFAWQINPSAINQAYLCVGK